MTDVSPPRRHNYPATRLPHAERRTQLLDVAEALFVERGYGGVSIEEIARAASVTRPTVYHHFETREGVYLACVQRARADFEERLLGAIDPARPFEEQLRAGGRVFFDELWEHPGRWMLLFGSNTVLPGDHSRELADLRFGTIDQIAGILRANLTGLPDRRIEALAHAVSGVGERLGHWWVADPTLDRDELLDLYVETLWAGIGPYVRD